ncbi:MAG: serine/threonine protein kinase [Bacteroidales bacterium]|nr:serine/threonine protein kinase [Bacteroidales bacterium]
MESESEFITGPTLDGNQSALELLHRSESGFCEIWRADKFGQFVVYKCLKEEYRGDPIYETLLHKEFSIGYGLNHPGVCRVWNFFFHTDLGNCIEMEWVDGEPLSDRFKKHKPSKELFRKIASELCDALAYLHSRQVIHRDITPANILITHNGNNVKLIDFGLADADSSSVLKMQAGTKQFIAPEVLAGGVADIRSDIWALSRVLSTLTGSYGKALRKASALNPDVRFQHVGDFKRALLAKHTPVWPYLLLLLIMAGAIAWFVNGKEETEVPDVPADVSDTLASPTVNKEQGVKPSRAKPSSSKPSPADKPSNATVEDINDLLQSATDLFE